MIDHLISLCVHFPWDNVKFTVQLTDYPIHSVNIVTHTTQIVLLLMWLSHEILFSFFFALRVIMLHLWYFIMIEIILPL